MKKLILGLLFCLTLSAADAGMLFVKLIDARERPVMNAEFFWKRPDETEYRSFRSTRTTHKGTGHIVRHQEGFVYNYEIGKSVFVGGDSVDIKIVADGYEVKVVRELIPDGRDQRSSQVVIVLEPERRRR